MNIEKSFQELFPTREFAQLIEQDYGHGFGKPVELEPVDKASRADEDEFPVVDVVPVDVDVGEKPAGGGFPYLPGAADKRRLPMVRKMLDQQGIVYARQLHDRPLSITSSNSQNHFTINPYSVVVLPAAGTSPGCVEGAFRKTGVRAAVPSRARRHGERLSLQLFRAAQASPDRPVRKLPGIRRRRTCERKGRRSATGDSGAITG